MFCSGLHVSSICFLLLVCSARCKISRKSETPMTFSRASARVCVCVCPPLDKGFSTATPSTVFQPPFSTTFYRQGGREDLQSSAQRSSLQDPRKRKLITSVYLLPELLTTLSNLLCLIPWFFMLPTPKPIFPPQTCSRLAAALSVRFFECTCKHC